MSELACEVNQFHVKVKLKSVMVIEILVYYFVTLIFLVVDKESNVVVRYSAEVKRGVLIEEESFIFHGVSVRQG